MNKHHKHQSNKQNKSKKMRFIYGSCAIGLIIIGIVTLSLISTLKLKAKPAEIRAAGYPVTLDELNNYYPGVADAENAAQVYEQAFLLFHNVNDKIFNQKTKSPSTIIENSPYSFRNELILIGNAPTPIPGERLAQASQAGWFIQLRA